jgi:hypothetical protein
VLPAFGEGGEANTLYAKQESPMAKICKGRKAFSNFNLADVASSETAAASRIAEKESSMATANDDDDFAGLSLKQRRAAVQAALDRLMREGKVHIIGERDGQPVYALVTKH